MKTPDQLEKRLKRYFKVDLTDQEILKKLDKAEFLVELKLELLDKASSFISTVRTSAMVKGSKRGFEPSFLYKELIKTFCFKDGLYKAENTCQRLRDIICKARKGQDLSIIEYNWLLSEMKKF